MLQLIALRMTGPLDLKLRFASGLYSLLIRVVLSGDLGLRLPEVDGRLRLFLQLRLVARLFLFVEFALLLELLRVPILHLPGHVRELPIALSIIRHMLVDDLLFFVLLPLGLGGSNFRCLDVLLRLCALLQAAPFEVLLLPLQGLGRAV
eukprot:4442873-Pyramimonas_sp.AAC.1